MKSVSLVPFDQSCINEKYLAWLNDKELLKYSRQSQNVHSLESCMKYLNSFQGSSNFFWSIQNAEGEKVGTLTAYLDQISRVADIGILIGNGIGYGKPAWGEAITYLFSNTNVRKITAGTLAVHEKMIAIFEYWGMTKEGHLRQQEFLNSQAYDVVRYGLLKEEWLRHRS